jgi:hypothetical protein
MRGGSRIGSYQDSWVTRPAERGLVYVCMSASKSHEGDSMPKQRGAGHLLASRHDWTMNARISYTDLVPFFYNATQRRGARKEYEPSPGRCGWVPILGCIPGRVAVPGAAPPDVPLQWAAVQIAFQTSRLAMRISMNFEPLCVILNLLPCGSNVFSTSTPVSIQGVHAFDMLRSRETSPSPDFSVQVKALPISILSKSGYN